MTNRENMKPKNRLGVRGWVYGGRYGVDRYAYILHRITGLGLLAYFIIHIFVSSTRVQGKEAWDGLMTVLGKPVYMFGEFLVILAFAYHAANGIRLILCELGWALGKPGRPVFPYETSLQRQRPLFVGLMVVCGIVIVGGSYSFFFGSP